MKQYLVVGLGNFGASIVQSLMKKDYNVLAIDKDEAKVEKFKDKVTHIVQGDAADRETLEALGVGSFDVAIMTYCEASPRSFFIPRNEPFRH